MRVSQRLDYALRVLVLLAGRPAGEHVAAGELADELQLPRRFVEQQVTQLSRQAIVTCRRGAAGGCALAETADRITVHDVVVALNGDVLDVPHQPHSATAELWRSAADALADHLGTVTLADLAKRQHVLDESAAPVYYI